MGKYFGSEPRYSREEIERQAQEAIDARVSLGRPPAEDWAPLDARMAELDRAMVAPVMVEPQPLQIRTVHVTAAMAPTPAPVERPARRPVGALVAD